jgi:predicted lipoprotein with Yx(FWY)xxD motif
LVPVLGLLVVVLSVTGCGEADDAAPSGGGKQPPISTSPTTQAPEETSGGTTTAAPPSDSPRVTTASSTGTVITTGNSDFGEMLFDSRTQAIYLFEPEADGTPACYDACAEAWPPVLSDGAPRADGNVDAALLGTVKRSDGTTQVTYNGWPLYFYAHEGPGEVLCHDVVLNGGLWLALGPDGDALPA